MEQNDLERSVRACYRTWSHHYYEDYYTGATAYPPVHIDIVREHLNSLGARTVLDAGCGPASMLRNLELPASGLYGFDLTPEMVVEARRVLAAQGVGANQIWEGSVLDPTAFHPPEGAPANGFDVALCFGVLPHIPADTESSILENLMTSIRPGGSVFVEARNELFSLFTLNRYSRDFFRDRLIAEGQLLERAEGEERQALEKAFSDLDASFRLDLPPRRKSYEDEPGYDEILSRTHNPFELKAIAQQAGLVDIQLLFYHFHALPPMLEKAAPTLFRRESLARENPLDWRGHFMASAFILFARRPEQP